MKYELDFLGRNPKDIRAGIRKDLGLMDVARSFRRVLAQLAPNLQIQGNEIVMKETKKRETIPAGMVLTEEQKQEIRKMIRAEVGWYVDEEMPASPPPAAWHQQCYQLVRAYLAKAKFNDRATMTEKIGLFFAGQPEQCFKLLEIIFNQVSQDLETENIPATTEKHACPSPISNPIISISPIMPMPPQAASSYCTRIIERMQEIFTQKKRPMVSESLLSNPKGWETLQLDYAPIESEILDLDIANPRLTNGAEFMTIKNVIGYGPDTEWGREMLWCEVVAKLPSSGKMGTFKAVIDRKKVYEYYPSKGSSWPVVAQKDIGNGLMAWKFMDFDQNTKYVWIGPRDDYLCATASNE